MADKRTIKFEISVDADTKGVERFGRVLNDLQKAAPIADSELRKVRQAVLEFSQQSGTSATSLKALEAALTKLQSEAATGGSTWKLLGKDIAGVKQKIGELSGTIRSAEQAQKDLNRALNAPIGNTFGKIADQTATLKRELAGLKFRTDQYLQTLTRVREIETVGSLNQGRLNTIAANRAFMGATLSRGYGASQNLPTLPDTLAGDSQRVSELTERIRNLDRGSELYLQTVKELATAQAQLAASQAQLNRAVDGGAASYERINSAQQRRDAKRASIADYYSSGSIATRRNDGFGDRPQAQKTASGTFVAPPYRSGNFTGIGDAGLGQFGPETPEDFRRRVEPLVAEVERARDEVIRARRDASQMIVQEYANDQRREQQRIDEIASNSIRVENERHKKEIADFDRTLENRVRQREARRKRLRAAGETATAIGVAGYFGGPEAVVGAAVGSAFGPGGAQVGTTVGLAALGLRQQIGNTADQAAQLNKLQVSLRSIAGSEAEYTRALRAINTANRELNIPLLEGTRAMTQLTAAVKGAGGTVADAELAYQGITAAIKATGGSSADAEGAIRALVQTFSKGKVSAEEIRQQLAERLPGAVTLFAQATGRTGAELDKAFEQGKVGLNDLMKFLGELDTRYSETARRLAASNDEAGLRLQLRWEKTTLAIGKAFQPLGAEIQNTLIVALEDAIKTASGFKTAITEILSTLRVDQAAKGIGSLLGGESAATSIAKFVLQLGLAKAAIAGFSLLRPAITRLFSAITGGAFTAGNASLIAAGKLATLRTAVLSLARAWIPALALTITVSGIAKLGEVKNALDAITKSGTNKFKAEIGGNAQTVSVIDRLIKENRDEYKRRKEEFESVRYPLLTGQDDIAKAAMLQLDTRLAVLRSMRERAPRSSGSVVTNFDDPAAESDKSKQDAAAKRQQQIAEQLAAERQRMLEAETQQEIRLADEVYRHKIELENRRHERAKELADLRARAELAQMSPNQRGIAELLRGIDQSRTDYDNRIREAQQRSKEAQRQVQNASRMAAVTSVAPSAVSSGGRYIQGGIGPKGKDQYGPHFDIARSDGSFFSRNALDQFVLVNGKPISSGRTVSGGQFGASRDNGNRVHRAWDYAFGGSAALTLTGGARWTGSKPGSYGDNAAFMTPDGKVYRIIHGRFEGDQTASAGRRTPTGVAAQGRRNVADTGDVGVAITAAEAANANLNDLKGGRAAFLQASANAQIAEYVRNTRDSTAALKEETQQLKDRNRYTLEGYRPEVVEEMVKRLAAERRYNEERRALDAELVSAKDRGDIDRITTTTEAINQLTSAYQDNIQAIRDQTQAQLDARAAAENSFDLRLGARQYVESIGTMRDASATLTQTGIKGIEDALVSLATTGTANFQAFAVSILQETARMIIQQLILKTIMQAIGFLGGGSSGGGFSFGGSSGGFNLPGFQMPSYMQAGNAFGFGNGGAFTEQGVQLFAKGGIVDKPTFFKFANGGSLANGILGEAGPEAIMPLKRGADGKLGVVSAGGAPVSVTVNVDASGTSAQGNSDQSKQLGRAVAAAVQAELIKQKRPGGLLVT